MTDKGIISNGLFSSATAANVIGEKQFAYSHGNHYRTATADANLLPHDEGQRLIELIQKLNI